MRIDDFNDRLKASVLVADGSMGSLLHEMVAHHRSLDELNSTHSEVVFHLHQEYIEAGAQIIETNTFSANRYKLDSPPHPPQDSKVQVFCIGVDSDGYQIGLGGEKVGEELREVFLQ